MHRTACEICRFLGQNRFFVHFWDIYVILWFFWTILHICPKRKIPFCCTVCAAKTGFFLILYFFYLVSFINAAVCIRTAVIGSTGLIGAAVIGSTGFIGAAVIGSTGFIGAAVIGSACLIDIKIF